MPAIPIRRAFRTRSRGQTLDSPTPPQAIHLMAFKPVSATPTETRTRSLALKRAGTIQAEIRAHSLAMRAALTTAASGIPSSVSFLGSIQREAITLPSGMEPAQVTLPDL